MVVNRLWDSLEDSSQNLLFFPSTSWIIYACITCWIPPVNSDDRGNLVIPNKNELVMLITKTCRDGRLKVKTDQVSGYFVKRMLLISSAWVHSFDCIIIIQAGKFSDLRFVFITFWPFYELPVVNQTWAFYPSKGWGAHKVDRFPVQYL